MNKLKIMTLVSMLTLSSSCLALDQCAIHFKGFKTWDYKPIEQPINFDRKVIYGFEESREEKGVVDQFYGLVSGNEWLDHELLKSFVERFIDPSDPPKNYNNITFASLPQLLEQKRKQQEDYRQENLKDEYYQQYDGYDSTSCGYIYPITKTNKFISFEFMNCGYTFGTAHGFCGASYITYDVEHKKIISIDQVLPKENYSLVKKQLWNSYQDKYSCGMSEEDFMKEVTLDEFYFKDHRLVFSFGNYGLSCPYAAGPVQLELDLDFYGNLINKEYATYEICLP